MADNLAYLSGETKKNKLCKIESSKSELSRKVLFLLKVGGFQSFFQSFISNILQLQNKFSSSKKTRTDNGAVRF